MKYTGPRCGIWDIQYLISEMTPYNVSLHSLHIKHLSQYTLSLSTTYRCLFLSAFLIRKVFEQHFSTFSPQYRAF